MVPPLSYTHGKHSPRWSRLRPTCKQWSVPRKHLAWRAGVFDLARSRPVIGSRPLQMMNMMIGSGLLDPTLEVGAVRAPGQALSRLAEWEFGLLNDYVVARAATAQLSVDEATALRFADMILPVLERLHSYIWRRHLAALTGPVLAATPQELVTTTLVSGSSTWSAPPT